MRDTALEAAMQAMKAELRRKMRLRDDRFVETQTPLKGNSDA